MSTSLRRISPRVRAEAPSRVVAFRFSPLEVEKLKQAARMHFTTPSGFVRDVVLLEVNDTLDTDALTERSKPTSRRR